MTNGCFLCCLGGNILPGVSKLILLPGSTGNLSWSKISSRTRRTWYFMRSGGKTTEKLAEINFDDKIRIRQSSLSGIEVVNPATLLLKNVNQSYNGMYRLITTGKFLEINHVLVFIASKFYQTNEF